jgi:hypothetical protein
MTDAAFAAMLLQIGIASIKAAIRRFLAAHSLGSISAPCLRR